jgi:hypothetical protein
MARIGRALALVVGVGVVAAVVALRGCYPASVSREATLAAVASRISQ